MPGKSARRGAASRTAMERARAAPSIFAVLRVSAQRVRRASGPRVAAVDLRRAFDLDSRRISRSACHRLIYGLTWLIAVPHSGPKSQLVEYSPAIQTELSPG